MNPSTNTAQKVNEYKNDDILALYDLEVGDLHSDKTDIHSFDAYRIMSKILQPRKDLVVHNKGSFDQPFISGFPIFSSHTDITQDMRPDVIIYPPICKKTKLDAFYQASAYAMFMARLYAHFGIEHPGYCIVFPNPKNEDLFGFSILKCQWDYKLCHFMFSAESINCVKAEINKSVLRRVLPSRVNCKLAANLFIGGRFEPVSKFIFKLRLESLNGCGCFGGQYEAVEQLSSAHAIVLKVKQLDAAEEKELVIKVLDKGAAYTLIKFKDLNRLKSCYLIHHLSTTLLFESNPRCAAITFPYLVPPLTAEEARQCLKDYVMKIHKALESIHKEKFHHGDIRLENICFVPVPTATGGYDYDVCLIDLEMGYVGEAAMCGQFYSNYTHLSCLYKIPTTFDGNGDIDYLQLGYMILWVCTDYCIDFHKLDNLPRPDDTFLNDLLQRGVFGDIEASAVFQHESSSLFDVLQCRAAPNIEAASSTL